MFDGRCLAKVSPTKQRTQFDKLKVKLEVGRDVFNIDDADDTKWFITVR